MRIVLAAVTCLLASPAIANEAHIACVQNQLNAAGYDAGTADGLIGRRTRTALEEFSDAHELDQTMPLSEANSAALCRRIGLTEPELKAFWPSRDAAVEITISDSVPPDIAQITEQSIRDIHNDVSRLLGLELAGTDRVLVGTTPAELKRMISQNSTFEIVGIDRKLEGTCNSFRRMSGSTAASLIHVCVGPDAELGGDLKMDWLTFFLAHEITHLIQFQTNGTLPADGYSDRQRLDFEGPLWMIEGLAQVIANVAATSAPERVYREIMLSRYEDSQVPDLATLETRDALEDRRADIYRAGAIAATDLVEAHGYPAFGALFEDMGNGLPWADAFQRNFGQSPSEFYRTFEEKYRK